MPRIYKLSKTGLKILYKIRHHRGHGIHSPFVFNLVTKVIEEKAPYHVYDDIGALIDPYKFLRLKKHNLLSFRLVNHFKPDNILEIGSGYGVNTLCLTAASSNIRCMCIEPNAKKYIIAEKLYEDWSKNITLHTNSLLPELSEKQDCIYIDLNNYNRLPSDISKYLADISHEKTFIIVRGIRTNRHNQALWRSVIKMDSRTVVLDLFNIGIVFFDKTLYRWKYQISF
ncbi:class I SAM-dependent methyltransferase [Dysgonomonas sp. 521]|uniref:class I SAM-dependent methyltransferase n=1 Tax=Dysgonomonas sp. 521 TaxID=2302932 RepID=UPI0013D500E6|nr:class I SAM-dependent methyltransferase [Dysgonomonas sp. 521]NDV95597.1 class I SAM-dependent methyltransferase [Dysgonomonas sp. 521]